MCVGDVVEAFKITKKLLEEAQRQSALDSPIAQEAYCVEYWASLILAMTPEDVRDRGAAYEMRDIASLDDILPGDEANADIDLLMLWAKSLQARRQPQDALNVLNQVY